MRRLIAKGLLVTAVIAALGQREMLAGKMYWTDRAADRIERANLDGSDRETLLTAWPSPWASRWISA